MTKKYFGTDGIRGAINSKNINGDMFFKFGLASGTYFKSQNKKKQMAIIAVCLNFLWFLKYVPAAKPNLKNISPLILDWFTFPLIPSVPKYFFVILKFVPPASSGKLQTKQFHLFYFSYHCHLTIL